MVTVAQILEQVKALSVEDRKELVKQIVDMLGTPRQHSLKELRGLGKELWSGIDAQEYVNQLREEWDKGS